MDNLLNIYDFKKANEIQIKLLQPLNNFETKKFTFDAYQLQRVPNKFVPFRLRKLIECKKFIRCLKARISTKNLRS